MVTKFLLLLLNIDFNALALSIDVGQGILTNQEYIMNRDTYRLGFKTDIETDSMTPGLDEDKIKLVSSIRSEPKWLLDFRLRAFNHWKKMEEPAWAELNMPRINYDDYIFFAKPKNATIAKSLNEVDSELLKTFEKLGVPLEEQKRLANVAVDAVFDSVSIFTSFKEELASHGIIFASFSEAVQDYPMLIKKFLGSVVSGQDNFFAALNAAAFTDGTFVYVPSNTKCPMDLSTYFRVNTERSGQFERTLIVVDKGASCAYLEGCSAPSFKESVLHAAVVEIVMVGDDSHLDYSTVQNWYAGSYSSSENEELDNDSGINKVLNDGGVLNLVTKRALLKGARSRVRWTQVEAGSSITWKYPSCILEGPGSIGEFYSIALTNGRMQADTGTKMIHIGPNTQSSIISKGIATGHSRNTYRGLVSFGPSAKGAKSNAKCDSMLIGRNSRAETLPVIQLSPSNQWDPFIEIENKIENLNQENKKFGNLKNLPRGVKVEHEAFTTRVSEEVKFYLMQRGLDEEHALALLSSGFAAEVIKNLPGEFAVEANQLLALKLENSIG